MESRIHFQPIAPSETGATHGSRITKRIHRRPRNESFRARARSVAPTRTSAWAEIVNTKESKSARRKPGLETTDRKFWRPTNRHPELPMRTSPTL
jgi:hypothetical protein